MSEHQIGQLFTWRSAIIHSDLPATTRHVLITLSLHMNEAGASCFPSTALLARQTGLSERVVCLHLGNAKEAGWLVSRVHGYSGQGWRRYEYEPCIPDDVLTQSKCQGTDAESVRMRKGTDSDAKGTDSKRKKALTQGQCSTSVEYFSKSTSIKEKLSPNGDSKKKVAKRGSRLPEDWYPDKLLIDYALQRRPDLDLSLEVEKFRTYWHSKAGSGAIKIDWGKTWQNWILNSKQATGPPKAHRSTAQVYTDSLRKLWNEDSN